MFAFWSRIARTVAIVFAVLLAIPFVLGSLRSSGAGTRTLMGLLLGICFFLLQRLIESGTVVFDLNPLGAGVDSDGGVGICHAGAVGAGSLGARASAGG